MTTDEKKQIATALILAICLAWFSAVVIYVVVTETTIRAAEPTYQPRNQHGHRRQNSNGL